ncbi:hypothetical protein KUCAC02_010748 [Chaenocephalus aceratus]|uniref:Uncharacterized protein n=1 Tax=Chaenocephalus aceratus TaxID=36190 RepID=A0ACB9WUS8_CHAAC|nr:hypothetical protein KUCAC02_010748 [Chaenocephalus aceratus]
MLSFFILFLCFFSSITSSHYPRIPQILLLHGCFAKN